MGRKLGLTAGIAVACAAAAAGAVLAGQVDDGPGQGAGPLDVRTIEAERVAAPSSFAAGRAATAERKATRRKPRVIYLETQPQTLPAGKTGFVIGDCPGKAKAISGYYFVQGQFNGF